MTKTRRELAPEFKREGGGAPGKQRSPADADCDRVGYSTLDVAELARGDPWRFAAIGGGSVERVADAITG